MRCLVTCFWSYHSLWQQLIGGHDAYVLTFSLTSRESLRLVDQRHRYIQDEAQEGVRLLAVIGTKADLVSEREVSSDEGELLAARLETQYLETSKRDAASLESAIVALAQKYEVLKYPKSWPAFKYLPPRIYAPPAPLSTSQRFRKNSMRMLKSIGRV